MKKKLMNNLVKVKTDTGENLLLNLSEFQKKQIKNHFIECAKKGIKPKFLLKVQEENPMQKMCRKLLARPINKEFLPYMRAYYPNKKDEEFTFDFMHCHRMKMLIEGNQVKKSEVKTIKKILNNCPYTEFAKRNELLEKQFDSIFKEY